VFLPQAPEGALRTATTLLMTTRKAVPSSEVLWLHAQILLSAGQDAAALGLVREEGVGGGGIARGWWRIKTVQEVLRRMRAKDEGKWEAEVGVEVEEFMAIMRAHPDMCVLLQGDAMLT
jgi:hypothetical protein